MPTSINLSIPQQFGEVVAADLNGYQIIIPSTTKETLKPVFSHWVPVPERHYATHGWILVNGQVVGTLQGLEIDSLDRQSPGFKVPKRIGPAVPLNFECHSASPLPSSLVDQALFTCHVPGTDTPFHTVFRGHQPRFAKVYPCSTTSTLTAIIQRLLIEEARFVAENAERMQAVPFYRAQFDL